VVTADEAWGSAVVHKVNAPSDDEISRLRPGTVLVSLMAPAISPDLVEKLRAAEVIAMAMDAVPRISRAQSLDVLSSMANIAGYRAVVEAAHEFGSFFTGQVPAAGKVPPAQVLVAGAGVAGLSAIGTARSLGAIVRATDARVEVAEQVESMGADFLAVQMPEVDAAAASSDGYAKEMGEEYNRRAAELYAAQAPDVDIIITTALIPGRPAPRLITGEMVASMKPGSVIVDMAAANGGNVEGSVADEMVVSDNGVRIIGYADLAARLPTQASQLYGTNLVNLMKLLTPGTDGRLVLDFDDVVQRNMTVARDGELLWPPPAIQVSAAPLAQSPAGKQVTKEPEPPKEPRRRYAGMAIGAVVFAAIAAVSPASFLGHFTVFALAVVIGYYVIGNVHHALHTPLMSVTNAISGIIVVGALLQLGSARTSPSSQLVILVLAFVATLIASINIFGGFTVTRRMLTMFRKG
jgi:NAD(P) transhydrogenase subunit alpha